MEIKWIVYVTDEGKVIPIRPYEEGAFKNLKKIVKQPERLKIC